MKCSSACRFSLFSILVLVILASVQVQLKAQDTLVAYYPFNGNAADTSGFDNHGTAYGAALTADRFGNPNSAYSFDGVDDFIEVGSSEELSIRGDLTLSLWMKSNSFESQYNGILTYQGDNTDFTSTTNALYKIGFSDSSWARYAHETGTGEDLRHEFLNFSFDTEKWYNLVLVRDSSSKTLSLFVDGELVDSTLFGSLPEGGESSTLRIGENQGTVNAGRFFSGIIDDVRIYNTTLTSSEITNLYTEGGWPLPGLPEGSLAGYFPFNGNASDESGNANDGEVFGPQLVEDRFGNPNSAYKFNGQNDYIHTNSSFDYRYRTVSVWAKTNFSDSTGNNNQAILVQDSDALDYGAFSIGFLDGSVRFREGDSEEPWFFGVREDRWYHLPMVRNDSVVKGYVNGKLVGTGIAEERGSKTYPNEELLIGTTRLFDRYFNGVIDDIRIYDTTLDSTQIFQIYSEGGWPLPKDPVLIPEDTLAGYYPFNGNAEDMSGYSNSGEIFGADLTTDRFGVPASAYEFNGQGDYIDLNTTFDFPERTTSLWFKTDVQNLEDYGRQIVLIQDSDELQHGAIGVVLKGRRLTLSEGFNESQLQIENLESGKWYHTVLVRKKDSTVNYYLNGEFLGEVPAAYGGSAAYPHETVILGSSRMRDREFLKGAVDDVSFYNYALDSLAIRELYTEGGWPFPEDSTLIPNDTLVAYYPFSGSAEDSSNFTNNGEVLGASLTTDRFGNSNSAFSFDGEDDYIKLPRDFDFPSRTISFWFNAKNIPEWDYINDPYHSFHSIYISDHPEIKNGMSSVWVTKVEENNKICFHNGGADVRLANCYSINENEWYFGAMTVTPSEVKYYLEGDLLKTREFPGNIHSETPNGFNSAAIGVGRNLGIRFFDGIIDDIRIYNYALDSSAIKDLYREGGWSPVPVPNDTLAAYYPFNGNAEDESGYGNHGEVFGASLAVDRFGEADKAYSFDGIDDYIFIDNPRALHSIKNLSVSFWAKGSAPDTAFAGIISSPNLQPFGVAMDNGDRMLFSVSSDSIPLNLVATELNTDPGEWHQYVAVYTANEHLKLFKDGIEAGALFGSIPAFMDVDSAGVYVGALPVTISGKEETFYFSGSIDDIRFYNHALSSDSVDALYDKEKTGGTNNEDLSAVPEQYNLYQNYPNPFNPQTTIKYDLPRSGKVSLKVYDISGRLVTTLVEELKSAGTYQVRFDAERLASGIYLYELRTPGYSSIKKLTLIK